MKTFFRERHASSAWKSLELRQIWNKVTKFLKLLREIRKVPMAHSLQLQIRHVWPSEKYLGKFLFALPNYFCLATCYC